jgi:hypothetical protein
VPEPRSSYGTLKTSTALSAVAVSA